MITRYARLELPDQPPAYARLGTGGTAELLDGAPFRGGRPTGERVPLAGVRLLCPVEPSKVLCVGRNYVAHAKELGHEVPSEPLLFLKPPSALLGPEGSVRLPPESSRIEHEAELGVVIGRRARGVSREDALAHVLGYTAVCDVTARDLQKKDGQWTRAKGFDTFCPAGPVIACGLDPSALRVRCIVNGQTRQDGRTRDMLFDVPALIAYASRIMTLEPGDLLVTGTPEGVGPLAAGDVLEVCIDPAEPGAGGDDGIGVLRVTVASV
jgi:2-keto-4-pentenoate hydratase/2-oxohepta-3-ene-1,7-dioic acid hydratase in catechol pathway